MTPQSLPEDALLLAYLKRGDEAVFRALVDAWSPPLRRLARRFVRSDSLADEVVQETWLAVLRGIGRFEGRSSLRSWVFTILANRARTRGVREARSVPLSALGSRDRTAPMEMDHLPGGEGANPMFQSPPPSAESVARTREMMDVLQRALQSLPPRQRQVVELRDLDGADAAEVCAALAITETNQRVLLHRGRSRLRAALRSHSLRAERESELSRPLGCRPHPRSAPLAASQRR